MWPDGDDSKNISENRVAPIGAAREIRSQAQDTARRANNPPAC